LADVSQPSVDVGDDTISAVTDYTMVFTIHAQLDAGDTITVRFPDDTELDDVDAATDITLAATSGIGTDSFYGVNPTAAPIVDDDDLTVEITLPGGGVMNTQNAIGNLAAVEVAIDGVENPTNPDSYTLEVETSEEDSYVESESYDIDAPTVGGFVYVYNPSNILLATYGGKWALSDAEDEFYFDGEDYKIKVGAGTYELNEWLTINGEGLTLEATGDAEDVIIDAAGLGIEVYADDVTIDGFTIDDGSDGVWIEDCEDVLVTNCIITDCDWGVDVYDEAIAEVTDTVFEDCGSGIYVEYAACTVTDCEITGADDTGAIVLDEAGYYDEDTVISGNTITENEVPGIIVIWDSYNVEISGNTIADNEEDGIHIDDDVYDFVVVENDITNNEGDGIEINYWLDILEGNYIMFNNIVDNDDEALNNDSGVDVEAQFNWWGSATESDFEDDIDGDVNYEPWLTGEWSGVITNYKVAHDSDALDGKTSAGVSITGMDDDDDPADTADMMVAFGYQANPADSLADAIVFYDVFVVLNDDVDMGDVNAKVKLYSSDITEGDAAYYWTGDFWSICSDQEARDGVIWVTITEDTIPALEDLEATPFAVVAGEAAGLGVPVLLTPDVGDDEVSLKPTFAWGAVAGADAYYFQMADNADFVMPMIQLHGDAGRLYTTAYAYVGTLPYSTSYYWRVKAVSGTVGGGDLMESGWVSGVFTTMAEPEEPTPPIVVEEAPPVTVNPIVEVVPPAVEQITPAWIYVIIGIGALLVIALLVLIIRTRRVA
jgi:parallel beta-helix repeat protein